MKRPFFRWAYWNLEHATQHGVRVEECEQVVRAGRYRRVAAGKYRAVGRGDGGRWLQVVFVVAEEDENEVFIIHARPLTDAEKHREKRRT